MNYNLKAEWNHHLLLTLVLRVRLLTGLPLSERWQDESLFEDQLNYPYDRDAKRVRSQRCWNKGDKRRIRRPNAKHNKLAGSTFARESHKANRRFKEEGWDLFEEEWTNRKLYCNCKCCVAYLDKGIPAIDILPMADGECCVWWD